MLFGGLFGGLGPSKWKTNTLIDTTHPKSWGFAIGALNFWHKKDTIPGPWAEIFDLYAVRKVELYVKISE